MESTFFTTLTVTEEANLSGGKKSYGPKNWKLKKKEKEEEDKELTPSTPAPAPKPTVSLDNIIQLNVVTGSKNVNAVNSIVIK